MRFIKKALGPTVASLLVGGYALANPPPDWVKHEPGQVTFELKHFTDGVKAKVDAARIPRLSLSLFVNGIEQPATYAFSTDKITLVEPVFGQVDYYVSVNEDSDDGQGHKTKKRVALSEMILHETFDSQTVRGETFSEFLKPNRLFGVTLPPSFEKLALKSDLTRRAIELGYRKVVWVLRPRAGKDVVEFVGKATEGVDVTADLNDKGEPVTAHLVDRKSGAKLSSTANNFYFKVDAAFNGNAFFWDDMLVSLATISHHPSLVRSTIEFWLDVQDRNHGLIPREVRKGNLLSLWFEKIVDPGESEKANLSLTNPYLMHWVMENLYAADPSDENLALLKRVLVSVEQYAKWIEENRSVRDDKGQLLGFTTNALASGLDTSRGERGNYHPPEAYRSGWVDTLAQQISMQKFLLRWYQNPAVTGTDRAGANDAKIRQAREKIAAYEKLLNEKYWNEDLAFYFDIIPDGKGGWKQDTAYHSIAGFWALFAGAASPHQVERMASVQLRPDHFGGQFPFPANSLDSVKLIEGEDGYWEADARWPSMAAIAMEGLRLSGRPDLAYQTAVGFLRGMQEASMTTVYEYYGLTEKMNGTAASRGRVGHLKDHVTRSDFTGWGKVPPVFLMVQDIVGLEPRAEGALRWNVFAPLEIGESISVENYMFHGQLLPKVSLTRVGPQDYHAEADGSPGLKFEIVAYRDARGRLRPKGLPVPNASVKSLARRLVPAGKVRSAAVPNQAQ